MTDTADNFVHSIEVLDDCHKMICCLKYTILDKFTFQNMCYHIVAEAENLAF